MASTGTSTDTTAFASSLQSHLTEPSNALPLDPSLERGENDAVQHVTSGGEYGAILDLYAHLTRDNLPTDESLASAYESNPLLFLKLAAQTLDCRQRAKDGSKPPGKGERTLSVRIFLWLLQYHPEHTMQFLQDGNFEYYGRWDILLEVFAKTPYRSEMGAYYVTQLKKDISLLDQDPNTKEISLAAKWAPSEGKMTTKNRGTVDPQRTGPKKSRIVDRNVDPPTVKNTKRHRNGGYWEKLDGLATAFAVDLAANTPMLHMLKNYRQTLTRLRSHIKIVETDIAKGRYQDIDYSRVPSIAMKRYGELFKINDTERFKAYLDQVKKGEKKINAGQMMPHEVVEEYCKNPSELNDLFEAQWNAILEPYKTGSIPIFENAIALSDVSGSMNGTPMNVSVALGILISQVTGLKGFKDRFMTFDKNPSFVDLSSAVSLRDKIATAKAAPWGNNTDFAAAMRAILKVAKDTELSPETVESITLFVFTDMQFDEADNSYKTTHQILADEYRAVGYSLPKMVYWNVRGTHGSPVESNIPNVAMISGYSPSVLASILTGKTVTPMEQLIAILNHSHYDRVRLGDELKCPINTDWTPRELVSKTETTDSDSDADCECC